METYFIALVAYISFCIFTFANGVKIQTVSFRVRRKHRDIRKCSMEIVNNQTAVSGRISDLTGKCEHLGFGLDEQQILEPGYGYVEKVSYEQIFQKEETVEDTELDKVIDIDFPRIITSGSKLDFTFLRTPTVSYDLMLDKGQGESPVQRKFRVLINEVASKISVEYEATVLKKIDFDWRQFCLLNRCKISIHVLDGYIQILANNQMIPGGVVESALIQLQLMGRVKIVLNTDDVVKFDRFKIAKQ